MTAVEVDTTEKNLETVLTNWWQTMTKITIPCWPCMQFPAGVNSVQPFPADINTMDAIPRWHQFCANRSPFGVNTLRTLLRPRTIAWTTSHAGVSFTRVIHCSDTFLRTSSQLASVPRARFPVGVNSTRTVLCWRQFYALHSLLASFLSLHSMLASISRTSFSAGVNSTRCAVCWRQFYALHSLFASVPLAPLSAGVSFTHFIICWGKFHALHSLLASVIRVSFSAGVSFQRFVLCWRQYLAHHSLLTSTSRTQFLAGINSPCIIYCLREFRLPFPTIWFLRAPSLASVSCPYFIPDGGSFPPVIPSWR